MDQIKLNFTLEETVTTQKPTMFKETGLRPIADPGAAYLRLVGRSCKFAMLYGSLKQIDKR